MVSKPTELDLKRAIRKEHPNTFLPIEHGLGGSAGLPDLFFIHPEHPVMFVELKRDEKSPIRTSQKIIFNQLTKANKRVYLVHWAKDAKSIVIYQYPYMNLPRTIEMYELVNFLANSD